MSNKPYSHLSTEDYMALSLSAEYDGEPVFEGEEMYPVSSDGRHALVNTKYLEVSPDQLIDVAKSIDTKKMSYQDVIKKAYALICEAHLISKNLRHWNELVSRNHHSKLINDLVENSQKNDEKQPLRLALLVDFFKAIQSPKSEDSASREFNKWFAYEAKLEDYTATFPYKPNPRNHDIDQYKKRIENGWIRWHTLERERIYIVPEANKPKKDKKTTLKPNQHVTEPYWTTKDAWWPEATKKVIENLKKRNYLNNGKDAFLDNDAAALALTKFHQWIKLEQLNRKSLDVKPPIKPLRSKVGKFASNKDKGSDR